MRGGKVSDEKSFFFRVRAVRFVLLNDIYMETTHMNDLNNQITVLRTELNLEQDPSKKQELNKKLNILNLKKEIETIKKRIEQLSNS